MGISEVIQSVVSNAQQYVTDFSYPVFIADESEKPDLIATSVAIEVDGSYYLVTASHVLKDVLKTGSPFLIGVNTQYITINSEFVYSSDEPEDHFDIAFTELNEKFVKENAINCIENSKLNIHESPKKPHIAFIHGYPSSRNKQTKALRFSLVFKVKGYAFSGVIKNKFSDWNKFGKEQAIHTCMTYGKTTERNSPVKPSGISGGGLWVIPDINKPEQIMLNAIFIEFYKNDEITFSTKIGQVVEFIRSTNKLLKQNKALGMRINNTGDNVV